jgi:hypothetical protein
MWQPGREPISVARTPWHIALEHPGAQQMGYMRGLFTARPFQKLVPDQGLVRGDNPSGPAQIRAARAEDRSFALFYTPLGKAIEVDLKKAGVKNVRALWFNPRQNTAQPITDKIEGDAHVFKPMGNERALDWVLVIEDRTKELAQIGDSVY